MSPPGVEVGSEDVSYLPLQLDGKQNGVNRTSAGPEDVKMEAAEKTKKVLSTYRCLIADLCHQFGCGHPG